MDVIDGLFVIGVVLVAVGVGWWIAWPLTLVVLGLGMIALSLIAARAGMEETPDKGKKGR